MCNPMYIHTVVRRSIASRKLFPNYPFPVQSLTALAHAWLVGACAVGQRLAAAAAMSGAQHTTRSMFGSQVLSARSSAPSFGFGSSTRSQAAKVFLSREHAELSNQPFSPGPVYTLRASVGHQNDGRKKDAPHWVFGSNARFFYGKGAAGDPAPGHYDISGGMGPQVSSAKTSQPMVGFGTAGREHVAKVFVTEEHNKSLFGLESPGPMMYSLNASVGKQDLSRRANQPSWIFATSQRFKYDHVKRASTSPGPGAYYIGPSVGPQVASTRESAPMAGFGTSNREHMSKVYLTAEHEKASVGRDAPGPGNYAMAGEGTTGGKMVSKFKSMPSFGFGTATRWSSENKTAASVPGPGSYCI